MSRLRFRASVLGRHPVPLRGVEASNLSLVRASSPIPLYHRYLEPVLSIVGGPCFYLPADRGISKLSVLTPLVVGGDYTTLTRDRPFGRRTSERLSVTGHVCLPSFTSPSVRFAFARGYPASHAPLPLTPLVSEWLGRR